MAVLITVTERVGADSYQPICFETSGDALLLRQSFITVTVELEAGSFIFLTLIDSRLPRRC